MLEMLHLLKLLNLFLKILDFPILLLDIIGQIHTSQLLILINLLLISLNVNICSLNLCKQILHLLSQ